MKLLRNAGNTDVPLARRTSRMKASVAIEMAASAISDEEVVERVKAGETALFEVLMRRHNQRLYRIARSILDEDGEAEDGCLRSFLHAFRPI